MLDDIYFFTELSANLKKFKQDSNPNQLIKDLKSLFYEFIFFFLQNQKQFFPSNFARIIFIINNFNPEDEIKEKLLFSHSFLSKNQKNNLEKTQYEEIIYILADLFAYFLKKPKPIELTYPESYQFNSFEKFFKNYPGKNQIVNLRKLIVDSSNQDESIILCYDDVRKISIDCKYKWQEIPKVVEKGTILNCFGLVQLDELKFATSEQTLIIIEPDYLYDITDISQCFTQTGSNAYLYFLNKFSPKQTTYYTFLGNIVNQILDILLSENVSSYEDIIHKAFEKKILSYLVLKQKDPNFEKNIYTDAELHYQTLRNVVETIRKFSFQIEPTFFSADYGIIGRMDVLLESKLDSNWKTIIELKSGNPPTNHINISLSNQKKYPIPMWISHYAQTIGYNLLLDSAVPNRKGSSMILYSKDSKKPLREAISTIELKREFIRTRNWIFLLESQLAKGRFTVLKTLTKILDKENGSYFQFKNYFEILNSVPPELRALIEENIKFIINENIVSKVGELNNANQTTQSSLWNVAMEDKEEFETTLVDLKINFEKSDLPCGYLFFETKENTSTICSLRRGDPVVIYHPGQIQNPYSFQLFKAAIKQIEPEFLVVTLRNKFSDLDKFKPADGWILEQDFIESTTRYLFQSLFNFLLIEKDKSEFLLGKKPAKKHLDCEIEIQAEFYSEVIKNAIEYYPYYLVIGPPGTGKTRFVVKELIKYYLFKTNKKILVCTYTNRAVDEIADVLVKENCEDYFIRIGNKESSDFTSNMLSYLSEQLLPEILEERLINCRIFIGTAYSFLTNPEIFELNKFNIAIIDEASQLLFPHIAGIIAQVEKFILIGDEKQLPAVILQDKSLTKAQSNYLKELGYEDLSISYFEFLLQQCRKNGWTESISILDQQSRMHPEVLSPVNSFFYQGVIKTNPNRVENKQISQLIFFIQRELGTNNDKRVIFVDTRSEKNKKSNLAQANLIAKIINECFQQFSENISNETFGVISPFRIQNAEIYSRLHPEIRKLVTIDTIERFQGSERDIIFLSLPFNRLSEISLSSNIIKLADGKSIDRKLNVALTRAKELLVILGNYELLSHSIFYRDFLIKFFDNTNLIRYQIE
ncbi:MAG: AAA domain-containing protein [Candidatus Kapaibacteriota bacterium]